MFGVTLDVAIGVVLIYLLFSTLVATCTEIIAAVMGLRAAALENAIARLIEDPQAEKMGLGVLSIFGAHKKAALAPGRSQSTPDTLKAGVARPDISGASTPRQSLSNPKTPKAMAQAVNLKAPGDQQPLPYTAVFNHPLVAGTQGHGRPAYVSSANFCSALLFALRGAQTGTIFSDVEGSVATLPEGSLKSTLVTLIREAEGDLDILKAGVGRWFDSAMDRLSGEYKRSTQLIAFGIGLVVAIMCNVDSVRIVGALYAEPNIRTGLVASANDYILHPPAQAASANTNGADAPDPEQAIQGKVAAASTLSASLLKIAPVGWPVPPWAPKGLPPLTAVLGWLVTALAGMLGAPFWFDTLQKIMNVRNAGPKPADADSDSTS